LVGFFKEERRISLYKFGQSTGGPPGFELGFVLAAPRPQELIYYL
jgi:hypothetical protein